MGETASETVTTSYDNLGAGESARGSNARQTRTMVILSYHFGRRTPEALNMPLAKAVEYKGAFLHVLQPPRLSV